MNQPERRRRRQKRGAVLLVVLTLLALFVVIGITYVVVAGHYLNAARSGAMRERREDDPRVYMERALYQILRDTNVRSSLGGHSLLRDLYGNDGVVAEVAETAVEPIRAAGGGEFVQFTFRLVLNTSEQPFSRRLVARDHYYNGCVVTFLSGAATGHSTRIVDYFYNRGPNNEWGATGDDDGDGVIANDINDGYDSSTGLKRGDDVWWFRIERFESDLAGNVGLRAGDRFLINGRPFNGSGAGFWRGHPENVATGLPANRNPLTGDTASYNLDAPAWEPGPDAKWGEAGTDDDGINGTDDAGEAGFPGTDDVANPVVLLPHYAGYDIPTRRPVTEGGMDEGHDAVDEQNMLLAMMPPNPTTVQNIIPSMHRPALVNFWQQFGGPWSPAVNPKYRDFRRKVIARPMPYDHPNFTGSNPLMAELVSAANWNVGMDGAAGVAGVDDDGLNGDDDPGELGWPGSDDYLAIPTSPPNPPVGDRPFINAMAGSGVFQTYNGQQFFRWDVDNNNDNVPDSVWLDFGAPVMTSPDGRQYKPLVAILCQDLDGRLNINAAGNLVQLVPQHMTSMTGSVQVVPLPPNTGPFAGGRPRRLSGLPRGEGFGPAEIFFGHIFNPGTATVEYQNILRGRYGRDNVPGTTANDTLSQVKSIGIPSNYFNQFSDYQSPPDVWGRGAIGLDYFGQPRLAYKGQNGETLNDPYEIDLSKNAGRGGGGVDTPYTLAELERLLRWADVDATTLPDRLLAAIAPSLNNSSATAMQRRGTITTDSWHIPMPNFAIPPEMRQALQSGTSANGWVRNMVRWNPGRDGRWGIRNYDDNGDGTTDNSAEAGAAYSDDVMYSANLFDLIAARLRSNSVSEVQLANEMRKMIPFEMLRGGLFNVNRRWGDARDNNGNFVVDEPGEGDGVDNDGNNGIDDPGEMESNGRDDNSDPPPGIIDELAERNAGDNQQLNLATGTYFDNAQMFENNGVPGVPHLPSIGRPRMGRQIYARQLYCLMMFLLPDANNNGRPDFDADGDGSADSVADRNAVADRLAQWAVNVVDFRDPDVINTPFEYDRNPFNGWQVDGLIADTDNDGQLEPTSPQEASMIPPTGTNSDRQLVWGVERPELLLTETMAFHDRRTRDLDKPYKRTDHMENGMVVGEEDARPPKKDDGRSRAFDDYDQRTRPKSGLFVEIFNPWTSGELRKPTELYRRVSGSDPRVGVALNLSSAAGSPVWRLLVVRGTSSEKHSDPDDLTRSLSTRQSYASNAAERSIYFANPAAIQNHVLNPAGKVKYYSTLGMARLLPGRYAVIGPQGRTGDHDGNGDSDYVTTVGLRTDSDLPGGGLLLDQTRRVVLEPSTDPETHQVRVEDNQGSTPPSGDDANGDIRPVVAVVINNSDKRDDQAGTRPLPLSISEPIQFPGNPEVANGDYGYPELVWYDRGPDDTPMSLDELVWAPGEFGGEGAYVDDTGMVYAIDEPLDRYRALENDGSRRGGADADAIFLLRNGTQEDFRNIHLQRLANPLLAWNPVTNPYLTVDSMSVDLTAFNGITNDNNDKDVQLAENRVGQRDTYFATLQRGEHDYDDRVNAGEELQRNLWLHERPNVNPNDLNDWNKQGGADHYFNRVLKNTLGWLSEPYYPYYTGDAMSGNAPNLASSRDYVGAPDSENPPIDPMTGLPRASALPPFPWLVWPNRPFASPRELVNVPWKRQSQLTVQFDARAGSSGESYDRVNSRFNHLLNFFQSSDDSSTGQEPALLNRLFELIEVPSAFVGTEKWYNVDAFSAGYQPGPDGEWGFANHDDDGNGVDDDQSEAGWPGSDDESEFGGAYADSVRSFRPPFNYLPRFREPGRVNLNTMFDGSIWSGLGRHFPAMDTAGFLNQLVLSRQGFGSTPLQMNSGYPSLFANPFRSEWHADLMPPLASMRKDGQSTARSTIQATLARGRLGTERVPLFSWSSTNAPNDTRRNPYFRYQGLNRLSNLVTTHSNVYAIWITVGFFEVEASPAGPNPAHPDGYMLGQELGADSGNVKRHRGFFMVDRSIPVAFEPGENRNVDRCVLVRRFIE